MIPVLAILTFTSSSSSLIASILSLPEKSNKTEGETARFPCHVTNLGPRQQVVWRRSNQVLAAGAVILTPDARIKVTDGTKASLTISSVKLSDQGEYACQVTTEQGVQEIQHTLQVQIPASIHPIPLGGHVTGKEGKTVTLRCQATGVPAPVVQWHKSVGTVPGGRVSCGGSCYTIPSLTRAGGGDYICSAANGVGHAQHATITLSVLYPPITASVLPLVQGGGGSQVKLGCEVAGEPTPTVDWFREGQLLGAISSRVKMEWNLDMMLHELRINSCDASDFGNYSCVASNLMGSSRSYIEVHGRPSELTFLPVSESKLYSREAFLRWKSKSYYPVNEFTLLYRKVGGEHWTTVKLQGAQHKDVIQETSWVLRNLTGSCSYEAIVQAQNNYGWSLPSKILVFETASESRKSASSLWSNSQYMSSNVSGLWLPRLLILLFFSLAITKLGHTL